MKFRFILFGALLFLYFGSNACNCVWLQNIYESTDEEHYIALVTNDTIYQIPGEKDMYDKLAIFTDIDSHSSHGSFSVGKKLKVIGMHHRNNCGRILNYDNLNVSQNNTMFIAFRQKVFKQYTILYQEEFQYLSSCGEFILPIKNGKDVEEGLTISEVKEKFTWVHQSIKKEVNSNEITIYPNPTKNEFKVKLKYQKNVYGNVRLMDVKGRVIREMPAEQKSSLLVKVDLPNVPVGLYFLEIPFTDALVVKKLIIH